MRFVWLLAMASCIPHPPPAQPAPRPDTWAALDFEQRHAVMTFTVLPNMARTWRDFRHTEYPEMTCRTCHGKDAEAVSYRMPSPSLPRIDAAHPPAGPVAESAEGGAARARMLEFMKTEMVPGMIELTGASPEHFSCNSCHPK